MISLLLAALTGGYSVERDIVYREVYGEKLTMTVMSPELPEGQPWPCVVVLHGGSWMMGRKEDMHEICAMIASKGMVAATVQYRLAPKSKYPAMLEDAQAAVRYLRANSGRYHIDPMRMGACGASAGGQLALMLGFTDAKDPKAENGRWSSQVSSVLDLFGPTDMSKDYGAKFDIVYTMVLGKPKEQASKEIAAASPVNHVTTGGTSVFIVHGDQDDIVPPMQSKRLMSKLDETKSEYEFVSIPGMGHGPNAPTMKAFKEAVSKGIDFLARKLKKPVPEVKQRDPDPVGPMPLSGRQ